MADEAETIAAGLTDAQRNAILNAQDMHSNHGGYAFFTVDVPYGQAWPEKVAQFLTLKQDRLTPLGLRVRAIINGD